MTDLRWGWSCGPTAFPETDTPFSDIPYDRVLNGVLGALTDIDFAPFVAVLAVHQNREDIVGCEREWEWADRLPVVPRVSAGRRALDS